MRSEAVTCSASCVPGAGGAYVSPAGGEDNGGWLRRSRLVGTLGPEPSVVPATGFRPLPEALSAITDMHPLPGLLASSGPTAPRQNTAGIVDKSLALRNHTGGTASDSARRQRERKAPMTKRAPIFAVSLTLVCALHTAFAAERAGCAGGDRSSLACRDRRVACPKLRGRSIVWRPLES